MCQTLSELSFPKHLINGTWDCESQNLIQINNFNI